MKRLILSLAILLAFSWATQAQNTGDQTTKGKWLIEANTGFGEAVAHGASTGFGLTTWEGSTIWSLGFEGGYFVMDDLTIKAGLGYTDMDGFSMFSYKFGGKYYLGGQVPIQVDFTGASIEDATENPMWLGVQGGYAIFLNDYVSMEPGIRYNFSLNDQYSNEGAFELRIGFALHF
jgi:hypothetical protein